MEGFETRPWGSFKTLAKTEGYHVKELTVKPQQRLSLQSHKFREEHWYVVSGTAEVTIDEGTYQMMAGNSIDIPLGAIHRIQNNDENSQLIIIEIQTGTYFGEDDIIRYEDDYNRIK
jgi:mannose-6-phosphate isomerase-like protein (cupin superfamily)